MYTSENNFTVLEEIVINIRKSYKKCTSFCDNIKPSFFLFFIKKELILLKNMGMNIKSINELIAKNTRYHIKMNSFYTAFRKFFTKKKPLKHYAEPARTEYNEPEKKHYEKPLKTEIIEKKEIQTSEKKSTIVKNSKPQKKRVKIHKQEAFLEEIKNSGIVRATNSMMKNREEKKEKRYPKFNVIIHNFPIYF